MSTTRQMLAPLFGSRTRLDLLTLFMTHPGESFYIRQMAQQLQQSPTPIIRELSKLEKLGLVTGTMRANAKYYQANTASPLYVDLRSLIMKTVGLGNELRRFLQGTPTLRFAFVYGSFATADTSPTSDIDLFLIGAVPAILLTRTVKKLEKQLGREIQYSLFDVDEFLQKLKTKNDFIMQVTKGPKIMIVGDEDEFKRFTKAGLD